MLKTTSGGRSPARPAPGGDDPGDGKAAQPRHIGEAAAASAADRARPPPRWRRRRHRCGPAAGAGLQSGPSGRARAARCRPGWRRFLRPDAPAGRNAAATVEFVRALGVEPSHRAAPSEPRTRAPPWPSPPAAACHVSVPTVAAKHADPLNGHFLSSAVLTAEQQISIVEASSARRLFGAISSSTKLSITFSSPPTNFPPFFISIHAIF